MVNDKNFLAVNGPVTAIALVVASIYIYALFIPVMDYDAGHHACIALHMHLTGNYAYLIDQGLPYLDKPHLLFWLTSFCYKIFGVTTFAYKFPSFLFSLLAIYSTYRLCKNIYGNQTAKLAAVILATAFAFAISLHDVRMEGLLTGSVIFSVWQLYSYTQDKRMINLVLAALGLAAGFSTKGWMGAVIPVIAIGINLIYNRDWKMLFHTKWMLLLGLFAMFISPVVYCYYLQFNLHPETMVRGKDHINGVKFILWSQNIERMAGTSHGQANQKDYFFFVHSFLWAFLPWSLAAICAIGKRISTLYQTRLAARAVPEVLSIGTSLFFLLLFSFSKFKLPHYLNCLFPFFAILLADYLFTNRELMKEKKLFRVLQSIAIGATIVLGLALSVWAFPLNQVWTIIIAAALFIAWLIILVKKNSSFNKMMLLTIIGFIFLFAMAIFNFYPKLLSYQAGRQLALKATSQGIDPKNIYQLDIDIFSPSFDFYSAWGHEKLSIDQIKQKTTAGNKFWLYLTQKGLDTLKTTGLQTGQIFSTPDYRVSVLKPKFINPKTRDKAITTTYLIEAL